MYVRFVNGRRHGRWAAAWVLGLALAPAGSRAVEVGDARSEVVAELGAPVGAITLADEELLYFERGSVRLRDGRVASVQLVTAEEARKRREIEAAAAARAAATAAAVAARRKAEGEAVLRAWLEDPAFRSAPLPEQVARWEEFARRYPEVQMAGYLSEVTRRVEELRAREEQERRIAMLEFRASQAEQAAAIARDQASRSSAYMMAPGRTVYYVQPWLVPAHAAQECRDGRRAAGSSRASTSGTSASWPYDFGMRGSRIGISPRRPGMSW